MHVIISARVVVLRWQSVNEHEDRVWQKIYLSETMSKTEPKSVPSNKVSMQQRCQSVDLRTLVEITCCHPIKNVQNGT
jgi:hypothetical protein